MSKTKILKVVAVSVGLLLLVVGGVVIYVFKSLSSAFSDPPPNEYTIQFEEANKTVYIRSRTWGLTGDHEETRLQASPIDNSKSCSIGECLIIHASEIYYKKEGTDTLHVFAISSAVPREPTKAIGPIKVEITEVDTDEELRNHATRFGLSKAGISR